MLSEIMRYLKCSVPLKQISFFFFNLQRYNTVSFRGMGVQLTEPNEETGIEENFTVEVL